MQECLEDLAPVEVSLRNDRCYIGFVQDSGVQSGLVALLWTQQMVRFAGTGISDVSYVSNRRRGRREGDPRWAESCVRWW